MTPLSLPEEDRTSQDAFPASPQFPICCASGRKGTLGGPAPRLPSPKGKDKATCTQGIKPCGPHRAGLSAVRAQGRGHSSPRLCRPFQELKKPCPERGQKDSAPPDPQMLHEHILKGTHAPGWRPGHPSPSPFPGLWPCTAARVFAQFADPKVLHFPARPMLGKASHVLSFFAIVWVGQGGRGQMGLARLPRAVSSPGLQSGFQGPLALL